MQPAWSQLNEVVASGVERPLRLGLQSEVHVVSDGALWIQNLCDEVFGSQSKYLVDFYHGSEYQGEAGEVY